MEIINREIQKKRKQELCTHNTLKITRKMKKITAIKHYVYIYLQYHLNFDLIDLELALQLKENSQGVSE